MIATNRKNKCQKIKILRNNGIIVERDRNLVTAYIKAFRTAWDHEGMFLAARVCRQFDIKIEDSGEILSDF